MKNKPVITHVEILCLAARSLEQEIAEWEDKGRNSPASESLVATAIKPIWEKLEAIKAIYMIETGESYI